MSTFDPELANLDDPGTKLAIKGGRAGGTITGSPGGSGTLGRGGGGLSSLGGGVAGAAGDSAAIRALLRKRMLTTSMAPPYLSASAPAPASSVSAPAPAPDGMPQANSLSSLFDMASGRFLRQRPPGGVGGPGGVVGTVPPPTVGPSTWGDTNESGSGVPRDVNFGSGFGGTLNDILRNFLGSGAFSDKVNPAVMEGVRRNALSDAEASRSRNALMAQALGADPASSASYALQSDLNSQGGVAKSLADASLGELTHQRDYGQQLLMALLGGQGTQNQAKSGTTALDQILKIYNAIPKPSNP